MKVGRGREVGIGIGIEGNYFIQYIYNEIKYLILTKLFNLHLFSKMKRKMIQLHLFLKGKE